MADAGDVYKKADPEKALAAEFNRQKTELNRLKDPNHNNDDTETESDSSDNDFKAGAITFISAIDVGSHFVDCTPSEEIEFQNTQGHLVSQFSITNPCKTCAIAYFVYTSAPINVQISPNQGFIPAGFQRQIKIVWQQ